MQTAVIYDIHGNLPALDAVLEDVFDAGAERIVVGGDVVPGPMPRETLTRLAGELAADVPDRDGWIRQGFVLSRYAAKSQ